MYTFIDSVADDRPVNETKNSDLMLDFENVFDFKESEWITKKDFLDLDNPYEGVHKNFLDLPQSNNSFSVVTTALAENTTEDLIKKEELIVSSFISWTKKEYTSHLIGTWKSQNSDTFIEFYANGDGVTKIKDKTYLFKWFLTPHENKTTLHIKLSDKDQTNLSIPETYLLSIFGKYKDLSLEDLNTKDNILVSDKIELRNSQKNNPFGLMQKI